jgi:O-antigen/teichoic acid export membrane protein
VTVDADGGLTQRGRRSTISNAVATYGTNLAAAGLGLVNVLVVSRVLGPEGRGAVAFLTAMAWLVSQLASFGVQSANMNFGGARPRLLPSLAANSVVLALLFGGLAIGVLTLLTELVPATGGHVDADTRWIVVASLPIVILGYYLWTLAQSDYRFGLTNTVWLLGPIVNVTVNGALAAAGALSVRSAVATWVGGQTLATAVLVWFVARRLKGFGRPDGQLGRHMVTFGIKTHAGQIGMIGNYRLDQWLLGSLSSERALGLYSVAVAWAEVLFFLPNALAMAQRPDLVRATREQAKRQASIGFRAGVVTTVLLAAVMVVAAPFLCVTIFGDAFRGSIRDLRILALGSIGIVAIKQLGVALTSQRKPMLETAGIGAAFVVTVVLDVVLIPSHADVGASIASTLSYFAGGAAMGLIFVRALGAKMSDLLPRSSDARWVWDRVRARVRRSAVTST